MRRRTPTCGFVSPSATSATTSRSVGVRLSHPTDGRPRLPHPALHEGDGSVDAEVGPGLERCSIGLPAELAASLVHRIEEALLVHGEVPLQASSRAKRRRHASQGSCRSPLTLGDGHLRQHLQGEEQLAAKIMLGRSGQRLMSQALRTRQVTQERCHDGSPPPHRVGRARLPPPARPAARVALNRGVTRSVVPLALLRHVLPLGTSRRCPVLEASQSMSR